MSESVLRRALPGHRWEGVPVLTYKEDDTTFRSVTRQVLFEGDSALPVQLRYFEVGAGGHSTLERHDHVHVVWISRGQGKVYLGGQIRGVFTGDVLMIPSQTWHQFQATTAQPLGFHCLVAVERDKPHRPDDGEWAQLTAGPEAAAFLKR
jgi:quercetin dioxygenase-like cupin family protein